ncbi:hypothetical protein NW754_000969 [Fusarium falciforme]|nr:hypothetical protein NW754_000969 [Fusarium falciforme]
MPCFVTSHTNKRPGALREKEERADCGRQKTKWKPWDKANNLGQDNEPRPVQARLRDNAPASLIQNWRRETGRIPLFGRSPGLMPVIFPRATIRHRVASLNGTESTLSFIMRFNLRRGQHPGFQCT